VSAQHTPGPWRISGCRHANLSGPDDLLIEHGDEETFSPCIAQIYSDGGRLPIAANAALIAAAPALLEALQAAKIQLELILIINGSRAIKKGEVEHSETLYKARAAIALAKGEVAEVTS